MYYIQASRSSGWLFKIMITPKSTSTEEFSPESLRNSYWFHEEFIGFGNPTIRIRGSFIYRRDEEAQAAARIYEGISNNFDHCKKGIFRNFDSLLVEEINRHLVPIDQLGYEYEEVLNGDSQTKRLFLQELFLAVPTDDVNLSSLLYHMLVQPATRENGYYILAILPRVIILPGIQTTV